MEEGSQYARLLGGQPGSPEAATQNGHQRGFFFHHRMFGGPEQITGESDEEEGGEAKSNWWSRLGMKPTTTAADAAGSPPQSALLTLIPLSDHRLRPRRTNLIIGILLLLASAAVTTVYVLVPRGVTVGSIKVHSSQISFNTSKSTYQILLTGTILVYNPNYLPVEFTGTINVSFYDQQAGSTRIQPVRVPARALPQVVTVGMDASSVPQRYLFTIYTQCFTFPEKLIFFLTGSLQATYLGKEFQLPLIDNYFIISCTQPGDEAARGNLTLKPESKRTLEGLKQLEKQVQLLDDPVVTAPK